MKPTNQEFTKWRTARRGVANPENMTNPLWVWGVENPQSGFEMNEAFEGDSSFDEEPCWSFERFGQTKTVLADGTTVHIAGEHEDHYDPDFFIYNDVVVTMPKGEITIYGYSLTDFAATDFHTATLVDDDIILIGSLGYPDERDPTQTQVLILDTKNWSIRKQLTTDSPGWISHHESSYDAGKPIIRITDIQKWTENHDLADDFSTWELDLTTWKWRCTEVKNWSQYKLSPKNGEMSNLWEIRSDASMKELDIDKYSFIEENDIYSEEDKAIMREGFKEIEKETEKILKRAKPELIDTLYHPDVPFTEIPRPEVDWDAEDAEAQEEQLDKIHPHNHYRIEVGQVPVCFIEDSYEIIIRIEGELDDTTTKKLIKSIQQNVAKVEGRKYKVSKV
jgi:hypothetical protein